MYSLLIYLVDTSRLKVMLIIFSIRLTREKKPAAMC